MFLRSVVFVVAWLGFLLASGYSQIASIKVADDGHTEIPVGSIVKLEANFPDDPDVTTLFRWKLINPPDGYNIDEYTEESGRRIYFATGEPGVYNFHLVIVAVEGKEAGLEWLEHTVKVTGVAPPDPDPPQDPPDEPTPGPDPEPDPPDEPDRPDNPSFGMSETTRTFAQAVNDPDKADTAKKLAVNYVSVAGQVASGKITRVGQAKVALVTANRRSLTADKRELWTQFAVKLSAKIQSLEESGDLDSLNDYRVLFLEISDGLLKVR